MRTSSWQKFEAVPRRARISGSYIFVSLNCRLENGKEKRRRKGKRALRKKDLCDQWAMTMHDNYHMMMLEVRSLSKYTVVARSQGHMEVAIVCALLA